MKPGAGWLLLLCSAAGAAYAADIYVSTTGSDTLGCGASAASPCKTIQFAVGSIAQQTGDRLRVLPGTYNECVNAGAKSVEIDADDCLTDVDPCAKTAIVDGTGVCDVLSGTAKSAVLLGDNSTLRGLTLKGGGSGGVKAFGDVVITRNEIRNNEGVKGGGIYVYSFATIPGIHLTVVDNNVIRNNTANVDGGGVFAFAAADNDLLQELQITKNTIQNNVAQGFPAQTTPTLIPGGFGGGISAYTFSSTLGQVEVSITENIIEGNSAQLNSGTLGSYGGGIWASTLYGAGIEAIRIVDNQVRTNTARNTGGGISAWAQGGGTSTHTVQVDRNSVSNNGADQGGGGLDLFMSSLDLGSGSLKIQVTSNELTGNRGDGFFGGGGLSAYSRLRRTDVPANEFSIRNNTIDSTNTTNSLGGGASLLIVADADPDQGGVTAKTSSLVRFERNLVATNRAHSTASDAAGGGVAVELQAFGDAQARAELHFDTVASNLADQGGGGIEIRSTTEFDKAGTNEGKTSFELANSIVSSNTTTNGFGVGLAPPPPPPAVDTGNLFLDFFYNDVFGNTVGNYEPSVGNQTGTNGNISLDPKLDLNFVPDVCSPTVDAADPFADFSAEPQPNGGRANQGHLGGTREAVRDLPDTGGDGVVDGLDVLSVAIAFASTGPAGAPRYNPNADLDKDNDVDGDDLAFVAAFYGRSCP